MSIALASYSLVSKFKVEFSIIYAAETLGRYIQDLAVYNKTVTVNKQM